ncbi:MAG: hypothetical protein JSW39_06050, partial [Desulfobacterales bacterium]
AALIEVGVDHIGSVILSEENWKVPAIEETIQTVRSSPAKSSLIPLFNHLNTVLETLDYYQPDIVHFCEALIDHQDHSSVRRLFGLQENVKKRFPEIKIMRSIPIPQAGQSEIVASLGLGQIFEPVSDFFLTDTILVKQCGHRYDHQPVEGFVGITGETCDWNLAAHLVQQSRIPVILAGGISPQNARSGILSVHPAGVDSCTQTNAVNSQGLPIRFRKDLEKVKRLVEAVRRAEEEAATALVSDPATVQGQQLTDTTLNRERKFHHV